MSRHPARTVAPRAYRAVVALLRPPIAGLTKQEWSGAEHLPRSGGFIVAANHLSEVDPFTLAHFLVDHGCPPLFLAKASLFRIPVLGQALHGLGQVPVHRGTTQAGAALRAAEAAVRNGSCVVVMPEGTLTRDPALWPMRAKTGVGRLALATRAPVIPIGQWGPQRLLAPYARRPAFKKVTMQVKAGPPVDLADLYDRTVSPAVLREATDRVMTDLTGLVADLRGEPAPGGAARVGWRGPVTHAAVYSSGSWGTAYAAILADAGCTVMLHARRAELAESINRDRVNADYLPDRVLPASVRATADPAEAAEGADIVMLAIPSQTLRDNLATWGPLFPKAAAVVSLMKGIELGTGLRMTQVITEVAQVEPERVAVVSGPNLSREIAARQPAASVVASPRIGTAEAVAAASATPYFRPYTQTDVIGAEIGGAVKNVIALAAGMAEGLGYGDNTKSTIITRGLAETARLSAALGGDPATLMGLAGVGDLIATCMSPLSRNHSFGVNLGRGMSLEEVVAITRQTAEGVKSARPVVDLAHRTGVDVPICEGVTAVVEQGMDPGELAEVLMGRPRKHERH